MTNHSKNILVVEIILILLTYLFKEVSGTDIFEYLGEIFGHTILPILNAHLLTKYIDVRIILHNELISMLLISVISLLIVNPTIIILAILGAMAINKLRNNQKISLEK